MLTVFMFKYYLSYVHTAHMTDTPLNRVFVWLEDEADDIKHYRESLPRILGAKMERARQMSVSQRSLSTASSQRNSAAARYNGEEEDVEV
jgi:hypothetical protein